jgi:cytochrome c oxidase assembly factor CtaG
MELSPWSWHLAWGELLVVALVGGAYAVAVRRYPTSRVRTAAFAAGLVLAAAVLVTPVATVALHYLLAAHLLQNVALAEWVPALLVLGIAPPLGAALTRSRAVRWATYPLVALPAWLVTYAVWHVPAVYDAALRNHALLALEHVCYLAAGLLLWWPVFQDVPHDLQSAHRAAYVGAAFLLGSPIGLLLTFLPSPVYEFYEEAPRLWEISALADQQIAGVVMSASEAIVFFAVFAFFVLRFLADEGAAY